MAPSNTSKIPLGTLLADKYRVTREIGRGGMAAVYEAENVDIGKRVAIKVLAAELTTSTIVVERFLREARAAASIRARTSATSTTRASSTTGAPSWCSSCSKASRSTSA